MLSLTACGSKPLKPIPVAPPTALMAECKETATELDRALAESRAVTNGDLVIKIRQLRVDLANCNADKAALREWTEELVH